MRFSAVGGPSNLFPSFVLNNPGAYGDNFGHSVAISNNYFIVGRLMQTAPAQILAKPTSSMPQPAACCKLSIIPTLTALLLTISVNLLRSPETVW